MKYFCGIVACIFLMFATACNHHSEIVPEPEPAPTHTLLIYMAGDNSLTDYCKENIRLLKKGLNNATEDINLVIYKDNRDYGDALPELFQLKKTTISEGNYKASKIDTVYIKKFTGEENSCDPAFFSDIVHTTFEYFDTEVKGLEIWSHGLSWIPSDNFSYSKKELTRGIQYVGQDDRNFLELWDIRKALEKCPHLDYICFDACHVGMAEVAHELDGVCDYIYGPITEIMGCGFPYNTMLPILADCKDKASVVNALEACVHDFAVSPLFIENGYTITLLETAHAGGLAKAFAKLRNLNKDKLDYLRSNASTLETTFQRYGRSRAGARYFFYDFYDYVDYLSENPTDEEKAILDEIEKNNIVIYYANSPRFIEGREEINLKKCKGLGVTVPEILSLTYQESYYELVYGLTKWGKELGY